MVQLEMFDLFLDEDRRVTFRDIGELSEIARIAQVMRERLSQQVIRLREFRYGGSGRLPRVARRCAGDPPRRRRRHWMWRSSTFEVFTSPEAMLVARIAAENRANNRAENGRRLLLGLEQQEEC